MFIESMQWISLDDDLKLVGLSWIIGTKGMVILQDSFAPVYGCTILQQPGDAFEGFHINAFGNMCCGVSTAFF